MRTEQTPSTAPAKIAARRNATALDAAVHALGDRARSAHSDPAVRVLWVASWSLKARPAKGRR